jgi:cell division protein FtsQ
MTRRRGASRHVRQERDYGPLLTRVAVVVGIALLLTALSQGLLWLWEPANMPIKSVLIQGEMRHVSRDELRTVVTSNVQDGFLRVDMASIRNAVEALPWIYRASVRRKWPATLQVDITEQRAVARWGDEGLINPEGGVFNAKPAGQLAELPQLSGPENSEKSLVAGYQEMQRLLRPVGLGIRKLELNQRRAWQLHLDNGVTLLLGRQESYRRLLRFVRAYPRVLADRMEQIDRIDMRYTNGFAVRWNEGATTA